VAPIVEAMSDRSVDLYARAISIADLSSAGHVIVGPGGEEDVLLRDSCQAVTMRLYGSRASAAPVNAKFLFPTASDARRTAPTMITAADLLFRPRHRIDRSGKRLLLRDALVAIDADCAGASYRETAALIFGDEYTRAQWLPGRSTWLKERMRHARAKGEALRDGGYCKLLL
jgi:hypothetical protein